MNNNLSFKKYLVNEMALRNHETIGDFSKSSSFRDQRDRMLITNPRSIEHVKKKFGNSPYDFDFYFVNNSKANKFTEVGLVNMDWVRKNLGDEVADRVEPNMDQDHIQVIFTNNKGAQRKNMSAWIMAHRIGHALARNGLSQSNYRNHLYTDLTNFIINGISDIFKEYGVTNFPKNENGFRKFYSNDNTPRRQQLAMLYFFYHIGTFKSARDKKIRDWFEIINELIAQYLTTGRIKFNPPPKCFGGGAGGNRQNYCITGDYEYATEQVETLARDVEYYIDNVLGAVVNGILVM